MTTRYATIITNNDGIEEVSAISQMEGAAPDVRTGEAKVEKVADDVLIGMVRGGPVDAVGGWGFPEGSTGSTGRSPTSAKPEPTETKTTEGDKPAVKPAPAAKGKAAKANA